jgi:hypothetical protein
MVGKTKGLVIPPDVIWYSEKARVDLNALLHDSLLLEEVLNRMLGTIVKRLKADGHEPDTLVLVKDMWEIEELVCTCGAYPNLKKRARVIREMSFKRWGHAGDAFWGYSKE